MKNFAAQVQNHLRITDACSRYGMDKIMLILPNTDIEQSKMLFSKLVKKIKAADIIQGMPQQDFCFSIQAGFAQAEKGSMLENMVTALDSAKNMMVDFKVC